MLDAFQYQVLIIFKTNNIREFFKISQQLIYHLNIFIHSFGNFLPQQLENFSTTINRVSLLAVSVKASLFSSL